MSGPTEFHGRQLLTMIAEIEDLCDDASSQGYAAFLDAVSTAKLLRALVTGAGEYRLDSERRARRFHLARANGYLVGSVPVAWETRPAEEDDAEGDDS
mgnify:FL=1